MKFGKYCPQTSTGLWSGITEKPMYSEEEMRECIETGYSSFIILDEDAVKRLNIRSHIISYFKFHVMNIDFMRQYIAKLDDDWRKYLESSLISAALLAKSDVPQNQIINSITYVKDGLVKYVPMLNEVIKYNKGDKE